MHHGLIISLGVVACMAYVGEGVRGLQTPISSLFVPVLHNLHSSTAINVLNMLPLDLKYCSISLRHAGAMQAVDTSLQWRRRAKAKVAIGVSTVSSKRDISDAVSLGVDYISTMSYSSVLVREASRCNLPIMSGCIDIDSAMQALKDGATALKFYPASAVSSRQLKAILKALRATFGSQCIARLPVTVAGGITEADLPSYLSAGATGFAVGFDCEDPELERKLHSFHTRSKMAKLVMGPQRVAHGYVGQNEENELYL